MPPLLLRHRRLRCEPRRIAVESAAFSASNGRVRLPVVILAAAALFAPACKQASAPARPGAKPSAAPAGPTAPQAARALRSLATGDATVKVISAGARPRRILAYAPHGGAREVALTLKTDTPPASIRMLVGWRAPGTRADPWRFAIDKVSMGGALTKGAGAGERAIQNVGLALFAHVKGRVTLRRGRFRFEQTAGMATTPSLLWLLYGLVVPFPDQPLGVGAKWEVSQPLTRRGHRAVTTRRYEIAALAGETVMVRIDGDTRWKMTPAAGKAAIAITGVEEASAGTLTVRLTDALPASARLALTLTTRMKFSIPGDGSVRSGTGGREQTHTARVKTRLELADVPNVH